LLAVAVAAGVGQFLAPNKQVVAVVVVRVLMVVLQMELLRRAALGYRGLAPVVQVVVGALLEVPEPLLTLPFPAVQVAVQVDI
jgi:hypothetical protein